MKSWGCPVLHGLRQPWPMCAWVGTSCGRVTASFVLEGPRCTGSRCSERLLHPSRGSCPCHPGAPGLVPSGLPGQTLALSSRSTQHRLQAHNTRKMAPVRREGHLMLWGITRKSDLISFPLTFLKMRHLVNCGHVRTPCLNGAFTPAALNAF